MHTQSPPTHTRFCIIKQYSTLKHTIFKSCNSLNLKDMLSSVSGRQSNDSYYHKPFSLNNYTLTFFTALPKLESLVPSL